VATDSSTLPGGLVVFSSSAAGAGLLATVRHRVHRCPGAPFGFALGHAAILVSFFDVFGLTLLLVSICALVSPWHLALLERRLSARSLDCVPLRAIASWMVWIECIAQRLCRVEEARPGFISPRRG
jgi:hypothetical protein